MKNKKGQRTAIVKDIKVGTVVGKEQDDRSKYHWDSFCSGMKQYIGKKIKVISFVDYLSKKTIPNWYEDSKFGFSYHKSWLTFIDEEKI